LMHMQNTFEMRGFLGNTTHMCAFIDLLNDNEQRSEDGDV
jgi:hypothetical protein